MGDPLFDFGGPLIARAPCLDGRRIKMLNVIAEACAGQTRSVQVRGDVAGVLGVAWAPLSVGEWPYRAIVGCTERLQDRPLVCVGQAALGRVGRDLAVAGRVVVCKGGSRGRTATAPVQ
jgi:hypothetical protein